MATDSRYLNNRLKYHTVSRVPKQAGDSLAASFNVDGHTVTTKMVWAAAQKDFPTQSSGTAGVSNDPIGATTNLITVFKNGGSSTAFWNGGLVWTNPKYPAVKLYENVPAVAVKASDGDWPDGGNNGKTAYFQAFEVLAGADGVQEGKIRVKDWIAPTSVEDISTGSPEAGFTGIFQWDGTNLQDNNAWTLDKGTWEFVYIAGMLTFEYNATPQKVKSATITAGTKTKLTITAFKYAGEYLDSSINTTKANITTISDITIPAIEKQIASLQVAAAGNELFQDKIDLKPVEVDQVTGLLTPVEVPTFVTKNPVTGEETTVSATIAGSIEYETINAGTTEAPVEKKVDSQVNITVEGEVIAVKQQVGTGSIEEIYPDMIYVKDSNTTTLTANYGLSGETEIPNIPEGTSWIITFRA